MRHFFRVLLDNSRAVTVLARDPREAMRGLHYNEGCFVAERSELPLLDALDAVLRCEQSDFDTCLWAEGPFATNSLAWTDGFSVQTDPRSSKAGALRIGQTVCIQADAEGAVGGLRYVDLPAHVRRLLVLALIARYESGERYAALHDAVMPVVRQKRGGAGEGVTTL